VRSPCDRRLPEARGERLFYGDNLDVLRKHFDDETVDLVYLDPPFNSSTDYSLTTRSSTGFVATGRTTDRRAPRALHRDASDRRRGGAAFWKRTPARRSHVM